MSTLFERNHLDGQQGRCIAVIVPKMDCIGWGVPDEVSEAVEMSVLSSLVDGGGVQSISNCRCEVWMTSTEKTSLMK